MGKKKTKWKKLSIKPINQGKGGSQVIGTPKNKPAKVLGIAAERRKGPHPKKKKTEVDRTGLPSLKSKVKRVNRKKAKSDYKPVHPMITGQSKGGVKVIGRLPKEPPDIPKQTAKCKSGMGIPKRKIDKSIIDVNLPRFNSNLIDGSEMKKTPNKAKENKEISIL